MTMQASDISNELLNEILITEGPWTYREQCQALARAELSRRAAKVEEVRYWRHIHDGNYAKTLDGKVIEMAWPKIGLYSEKECQKQALIECFWEPTTETEYERARTICLYEAKAVGEEIAYPSSTYGNEAKAGKVDAGGCDTCDHAKGREGYCIKCLDGKSQYKPKPTPPAPMCSMCNGRGQYMANTGIYAQRPQLVDCPKCKPTQSAPVVNALNEEWHHPYDATERSMQIHQLQRRVEALENQLNEA